MKSFLPFPYHLIKVAIFLLALSLVGACRSNQNLGQDDLVLIKNNTTFRSDFPINNRSQLKTDLESFYQQNGTPSRFWPPSRWFRADSVVIMSEAAALRTAENMEKYLQNKKGFYDADVTHKTNVSGRDAFVTYLVNPGRQYKVRSVEYVGEDKGVLEILNRSSDDAHVKAGSPLDAALFDQEKARITTTLQNNGYAEFVSNFIQLKGDSSDYAVDVFVEILSPLPDTVHKKFTIGEINVFTDYFVDREAQYTHTQMVDDRYFHARTNGFIVKPATISKAIHLERGSLFTKTSRLKTFRNLSNLSSYRFVYLNPVVDAQQDTVINYNIFLSPFRKKWLIDLGSDVFYSTISQVGRELFGFSANASLQNRNFLGGSERYTLDLEGTFEFDLATFDPNSVTLRLQNNLELPNNVDVFGLAKLLRKTRLLSKNRYQSFKDESTTQISLGYTFTSILEFYKIHSFNISWGYDYQPTAQKRFRITQIGFNLLSPETGPRFDQIVANNPLVRNSFRDNLYTGFLLRDVSYFYQGKKDLSGRSLRFIGNFEVSGLENYLVNSAVNAFRDNDSFWKLGDIEFSKFLKLDLDGRFHKEFNPKSAFAARVNAGIAIPYGGDTLVPYLKQFLVGGPNSIRAWQLRELGPGSYTEFVANPSSDTTFFQTGDLKFEFNLEYRWDLFWLLEAAIFLDGGNVWTLRKDPARPGSQISSSFFDEIALGTGWGLRWDFTYFLIRFDFGYRLRNPFPDPDTGSHWAFNRKYNKFPFGTVQVAVNYPF